MWSVGVLAYMLLSGRSPFAPPPHTNSDGGGGDDDDDDRVRRTLENVAKCAWSFSSVAADTRWNEISSDAKDFISRLLVRDPKARMSVEQACAHPWLRYAAQRALPPLTTSSSSDGSGEDERLLSAAACHDLAALHARRVWAEQLRQRRPWLKLERVSDQLARGGANKAAKSDDEQADADQRRRCRRLDDLTLRIASIRGGAQGAPHISIGGGGGAHRRDSSTAPPPTGGYYYDYEYDEDDNERLNPGSYLLPVKDPLFTVRLREYRRARCDKAMRLFAARSQQRLEQQHQQQQQLQLQQLEQGLRPSPRRSPRTSLTNIASSANQVFAQMPPPRPNPKTVQERYHVDAHGRCVQRGSLSRTTHSQSRDRQLSSSMAPMPLAGVSCSFDYIFNLMKMEILTKRV